MKTKCIHEYRLDVPHYFHHEDESVKCHYENEIEQSDDEVFTHLQCKLCDTQAQCFIDIKYLKKLLDGRDIDLARVYMLYL